MNIEELEAEYEAVKGKRNKCEFGLRKAEYRKYYPVVREGVQKGMMLLTIVRIIRKKEGAFEGDTNEAVRAAYARALNAEGIVIGKN